MDEHHLKSWIVKILPSEDAEVAEGTGFWAAEGGYVLTCTHVVEGMNSSWVEYGDQKAPAEIVAQKEDITLLKVQGLSGEPAPLGTVWQREDKIDSLGYQYEDVDPRIGYFPIEGTISGSSELDGTERITLEEAIHVKPGASGAPALNRHTGKVIGIISDNWEQHQVAFVLPLSEVLKQWDVLKQAVEKIEVEPLKKTICQFLETIESEFKYVPIFHPPHKIVLQDQYIPIEVTLERRYRHEVETTWSYAEGEAEFARAYAMKGFEEQKEETRRVQVPWQEAKQQHKRIIVLADPGMGKTALLKMEAVLGAQASCLHNSPPFDKLRTPPGRGKGWVSEVVVPLFFRLSEFADTDAEIAETIPRLLQRNYPDTAPTILPLIAEKLKNGTCLLLLDALDEVPQEQRNPLSEKLNRFARHYPSCPIIVTSRIVGYGGGILHDAKEVEIVPFSRKQIEQYIEIWFKNIEGAKDSPLEGGQGGVPDAKGLIRELQQKPQIRGLAQNPLLLSLLCSLYQEDELTLPARRVQIYEQAVHYMLYDWRRVSERRLTEKALIDEAWIEAKLELLEHLAYQFSCEYKEVFSMRELLAKIEECKNETALKSHDSPNIIKELSQEDGIIQQLDGHGHNTRYIFLHRTFQEYLTASYLKRQPNGIELAKAHFWDFDWHETLILFAGLLDKPQSELFLNTLLAERDDIFHTLLLLAGKCLAECPQLEMSKLIDQLYDVWQLPLYREFVEPILVTVGQTHQQMLTHLLTALRDTSRYVREQAAAALGEICDARAVGGMLPALHDPSRFVRERAASALGQIGDVRAVDGLLITLRDSDEVVRERAAAALGAIGGMRVMDGLLTALHEMNKNVRWMAAKALGKIGTLDVLEKLLHRLDIDIYDEDTFPIARRLAITFSRLHPQPACLPAYPQPLFLRLLKKGFWWMRILLNKLRQKMR